MATEQQNNVLLTIDPRKSRIRLHKTTLHALGDPKFIQFLISQKQRNFAIRAVDKEFTDAQPLKVNTKNLSPDDSYEVFSTMLVNKLCDVLGIVNMKSSYRLSGCIIPEQNMALFSFSSLRKIDLKEGLQWISSLYFKIDPEFKDLIRPLRRKEYLQLEENILDEGCRDPIIIWNDYIIDGINRYSICTKYSIPFNTVSKDFSSREEVIVWICKNQLGRRNITEETRKYLIGRQYESEKIIDSKKNIHGKNQHSLQSKQDETDEDYIIDSEPEQSIQRSKNKTAHIIGAENNITHATVQNTLIFLALLTILRSNARS